jgi:hypothetical protein
MLSSGRNPSVGVCLVCMVIFTMSSILGASRLSGLWWFFLNIAELGDNKSEDIVKVSINDLDRLRHLEHSTVTVTSPVGLQSFHPWTKLQLNLLPGRRVFTKRTAPRWFHPPYPTAYHTNIQWDPRTKLFLNTVSVCPHACITSVQGPDSQSTRLRIYGCVTFQKLSIVCHYVYPCQRFSTGNTLEDYNP